MSVLSLIRRPNFRILRRLYRGAQAESDGAAAVAQIQLPESLDTLEDFLVLERQLYGDASVDSFTSTTARTIPAASHKSFAVPRGRTERALNACWEIEDEISALLKKLAPGVFADWMPRDWQQAIRLAPTPWLRHIVRLGAAVRVRRLELSCRGHDFKSARATYRNITGPEESSLEFDAQHDALLVRELLVILEQTVHTPGRRRSDSCSGPPRSKRLTRTRPGRTRRAGHGSSFPSVGLQRTAARPSVVA